MALEVSISNCFKDSCSTLRIEETTGVYNVDINPTGYGAPNPTLASVTEAILSITLPDETVAVEFDLTETVNAATIIDGEFLLDNLTMGDFSGTSGDSFIDGIFDLEWVVTSASIDYTYTAKMLNLCSVLCCIEKQRVKFQKAFCGCDWDILWSQYQGMLRNLDAIKYNFSINDYTNTIKQLKALQKTCKILACDC